MKGAEVSLESETPDILSEFVDWAEKRACGLEAGACQKYLIDIGYQLFVLRGRKLKMLQAGEYLRKGACMLFATKGLNNCVSK